MNTKHCAPLASLALAITAFLVPATGCDINIDDLGDDAGGDTGDRGDDDDDNRGDDDDDGDDGDDDGTVDIMDGDDDGGDDHGDDGDGPGPLDDGGDGADGGSDDGGFDDGGGFDDDGGFDDGGFDDGGGNAGACESYCENELTCDEFYPDMASCLADCGATQSELGSCTGAYDQLNVCLGALSCDEFMTYWNALAVLDEGQDPGQFPCMNELGGLLQCVEQQGA